MMSNEEIKQFIQENIIKKDKELSKEWELLSNTEKDITLELCIVCSMFGIKDLSSIRNKPNNTIKSLEELNGKYSGKFKIIIENGILNVVAEMSKGTCWLYENTLKNTQDILQDLRAFGFKYNLKED